MVIVARGWVVVDGGVGGWGGAAQVTWYEPIQPSSAGAPHSSADR